MRDLLSRFAQEDDGATAIEYALIAALVAIFAIAGFRAFATSATGLFNHVSTTIDDAVN